MTPPSLSVAKIIRLGIAVCVLCGRLWAGISCAATIQPRVEVSSDLLTLADLLSAGSPQSLKQSAAKVRLGHAPLAGSARVLLGSDVREWLWQVLGGANDNQHCPPLVVPERIVVRRAGGRATCADIRVLSAEARRNAVAGLPSDPANEAPLAVPDELECGAEGRIFRDAPLDFARPMWNAALAKWQIVSHCVHADDCVPFLILLPADSKPQTDLASDAHLSPAAPVTAAPAHLPWNGRDRRPDVSSGEKVTLVWEQAGFRVVLPAVSLGNGLAGELVRARLSNGRVLQARVDGTGVLHVATAAEQHQ